MPSLLGIFVLSYSKRSVNKFVQEIDRFHSNKVYCQDTDPLGIHMDYYEKLKSAGFVGNNLGRGQTAMVTKAISMDYF